MGTHTYADGDPDSARTTSSTARTTHTVQVVTDHDDFILRSCPHKFCGLPSCEGGHGWTTYATGTIYWCKPRRLSWRQRRELS